MEYIYKVTEKDKALQKGMKVGRTTKAGRCQPILTATGAIHTTTERRQQCDYCLYAIEALPVHGVNAMYLKKTVASKPFKWFWTSQVMISSPERYVFRFTKQTRQLVLCTALPGSWEQDIIHHLVCNVKITLYKWIFENSDKNLGFKRV